MVSHLLECLQLFALKSQALIATSSRDVMIIKGSRLECASSLQSFGIPANIFPLTDDGEITTDVHRQVLEKRRKKERLVHEVRRVGVPGRNDVLFGRGKAIQNHVGNIKFRSLVEDCKEMYDKATRDEKCQITQEIVQVVQQATGRFLKDDGTGWVEVGRDVARLKVSHTFRGLREVPKATERTGKKSNEVPIESLDGETIPSPKRIRRLD
jgi:cystathionine beta-lyase family protein involved in aluminum resistance